LVIGVRPFTFFEKGVVGHVGFADPFDEKIAKVGQALIKKLYTMLMAAIRLLGNVAMLWQARE
jgi:hypothetical protein